MPKFRLAPQSLKLFVEFISIKLLFPYNGKRLWTDDCPSKIGHFAVDFCQLRAQNRATPYRNRLHFDNRNHSMMKLARIKESGSNVVSFVFEMDSARN